MPSVTPRGSVVGAGSTLQAQRNARSFILGFLAVKELAAAIRG